MTQQIKILKLNFCTDFTVTSFQRQYKDNKLIYNHRMNLLEDKIYIKMSADQNQKPFHFQLSFFQCLIIFLMKNTEKSRIFLLLLLIFLFKTECLQILDPNTIAPLMFTMEINGLPNIAIPTSTIQSNGETIEQKYVISMQKTTQKMLPGAFGNTTIYAYSSKTKNGTISQFPGPMIMAKKNIPIKVVWVNNITGRHMLPVDYSEPFINDALFRNEVPTVPHVHGIVASSISDGLPRHYWTASGARSSSYQTEEPCNKNEAIYKYPNEQDPGIFWYHDHTYGITRLNVYSGLTAMYEIVGQSQQRSFAENSIIKKYGQNISKLYFTISDRTFKTDGELYYPNQASSSEYTSWVPEFYGNTITVNGKVWPKIKLSKKVYRMVFLNACNSRYLNIFFLVQNQKLPFLLVRLEGDYFQTAIQQTEYLLSPSARLEILIDFTKISGDVMMKNNAPAPYPDGQDANLIDKFTGTIMKISVGQSNQEIKIQERPKLFEITKKIRQIGIDLEGQLRLKQAGKYPTFEQGEKIIEIISEFEGEDMQINSMLISGTSMEVGKNCQGSIFQLGKVYDFSIINLTPDTHPIHFHLVNFQKVMSYPIDSAAYLQDWYDANGGQPPKGGYNKPVVKIDPRFYQTGSVILPRPNEKVFRDVIDAAPDMVTVIRMKFSHNNGRPFGINVSGSRFVWHCHMLEHEDNEMMKYFCVK